MNVDEEVLRSFFADALVDLGASAISGGHILAGCLVVLLSAAFQNLLKRMPDSDIVAKAVLIAVLGGAIFLANRRIGPFAVSLVSAAALASLRFRAAHDWMIARMDSIPRPSRWPDIRLSTAVFSMVILVYLVTLCAPSVWTKLEREWSSRWTSRKLTVFTLPATRELSGRERSAKHEELEWNLFRSTRSTFVEAFSQLEDAVAILPDVIERRNGFEPFREAFADWAYDDEPLLEAYRAYGLPRGGEHVYVLRTQYDEGADGIDYTFRLLRLNDPPAIHGRLSLKSVLTDPVRLLAGHGETRRAALVAGTEVAKALVRKGGFDKEAADGIRTRLVGRFRAYYNNEDQFKDRRPADWPGRDAFDEVCETTERCLDLWMVAYSAPLQERGSRLIEETVVLEVAGLELLLKAATRTKRVDLSELPLPSVRKRERDLGQLRSR